ncbi:MAG: hypothetical protein J5518_09320 [Lachnospiraceae bacterium]|nr:hypothetical protein [Lachnospiraceae bacterium]
MVKQRKPEESPVKIRINDKQRKEYPAVMEWLDLKTKNRAQILLHTVNALMTAAGVKPDNPACLEYLASALESGHLAVFYLNDRGNILLPAQITGVDGTDTVSPVSAAATPPTRADPEKKKADEVDFNELLDGLAHEFG